MDFSKKLDRLVKKQTELSNTLDLISKVESAVPELQGKLRLLLEVVDQAFTNYENRVQQAERSLELSSKELSEANFSLRDINQTMDTILNNLDEGLVAFNKDGLCDNFTSIAASHHYQHEFKIENNNFIHLINGKDDSNLKDWLEILFDENMNFPDIAYLGPSDIPNSKNRTIQISYRPIKDHENKLAKVLAITKDITDEVEAKKQAEKLKAKAKQIFEVFKNPLEYKNTFKQSLKLLVEIKSEVLKNNSHSNETCKRLIHTLKGSLSALFMSECVDAVHDLESDLIEVIDYKVYNDKICELVDLVQFHLNELAEEFKLNLSDANVSQIDDSDLRYFYNKLIQKNYNDLAEVFSEKFLKVDIRNLILRHQAPTLDLVSKLNKKAKKFQFEGDEVKVNPELFENFNTSLMHIFRNIADHGFEFPEEREDLGKDVAGCIRIVTSFDSASNSLKLSIIDDGGGINPEFLREKIKERGLESQVNMADDHSVLQSIFKSQFSTRDQVTELSGRGVGLDVVKHEIERLNGSIEVFSKKNVETKFVITLPLENKDLPKKQLTSAA